MKGDFARVTFDPTLHYSQVFQQQGRVLLEADWNEQAQIQSYLLRTLICDLVGRCWAVGDGFAITDSRADANGENEPLPLTEWQLSPGHFYVDGILCANESDCTLEEQPNAPTPDYGAADGKSGFENFALWLDVWERHLCAVEAPHTADIALDGVDTASRAQVVWQLRLINSESALPMLDAITIALKGRQKATEGSTVDAIEKQIEDVADLRNEIDPDCQTDPASSTGEDDPCKLVHDLLGAREKYALPRLSAALGPQDSDSDPCVIAADARYRGCENQLYRVEIHQAGTAASEEASIATQATTPTATFKWSRENGSVVFPVTSTAQSTTEDGSTTLEVTLDRLGRDARLGLAVDDWVELVDDDYTLAQRASPLLRVIAIDTAKRAVTLDVPKNITPWKLANDTDKHPMLRRWDQHAEVLKQGVLKVEESEPVTLEDGIQVTFEPGGLYASGDYWLIAARVAGDGRIDWPEDEDGDPVALPPRGVHHYAVLGIHGDEDGYEECCCRFGPICDRVLASRRHKLERGNLDVTHLQPVAAKASGSRVKHVAKSGAKTAKSTKKEATKKKSKKKKARAKTGKSEKKD